MAETHLVVDFVVASVAALAGGLIAQRLRVPLIIGFLVAGVIISPLLPATGGGAGRIQTLADVGVALLMFALGTEFSLARLRNVGRVAILGGIVQILATAGLGLLLGFALGLDWVGALYWGCLISLSSTMVVLKLLHGRGELDTLYGHIAVGILIVQDLAVVPMIVILPALAGTGAGLLPTLGLAFAKAAMLILAVYLLGTRLVPWLLHQVASGQSRELLPLAVIGIGLGMALATNALGLSLAFGAFLAGLVISETEFEYQISAEVRPMRDIFASLFFVSLGMLLNPANLLAQAPLILALAAAVVLGKFVIGAAVPLVFGYPGRVALPVGLALLQIGEFSFVLAQVGAAEGIIPPAVYSLTLAVSLVTILFTPLAMHASPGIVSLLMRAPLIGRRLAPSAVVHEPKAAADQRRRAVILGYGRVGHELAAALEARGFSWMAVDLDLGTIRALRKKGIACVYGDAAEVEVLRHAGLSGAQLLAVALPDATSCERAVRHAREINPSIPIIVRARDAAELRRLVAAGAEEVVHPEFEAGLEFVRFALRRYGVSAAEVQHLLTRRRLGYYAREPEE